MEEDTYEEITDRVVLPSWLASMLPEPKEPTKVSYVNGAYQVEGENLRLGETSSDNLHKILSALKDLDVDAVIESHGPDVEEIGVGMYIESGGNEFGSRAVFSFTEEDHVRLIKSNYHQSQEAIRKYRENPHDFMAAFYMVDAHPAFWTKDGPKDKFPFDWKTDGYTQDIWLYPMKASSGGERHVWALEAGGHVEPEYTTHYRDLRLDVYAPSVEEAYIQLADLVVKFFHDDGTPREGVEYEKSDLEKVLEERAGIFESREGKKDG